MTQRSLAAKILYLRNGSASLFLLIIAIIILKRYSCDVDNVCKRIRHILLWRDALNSFESVKVHNSEESVPSLCRSTLSFEPTVFLFESFFFFCSLFFLALHNFFSSFVPSFRLSLPWLNLARISTFQLLDSNYGSPGPLPQWRTAHCRHHRRRGYGNRISSRRCWRQSRVA